MSSNQFNSVLTDNPRLSHFDLSHDVKMSFRMGGLFPTAAIDVLPGDRFKINVENMLRFAPLIAPVMHEAKVKTYWFFVPNRLLWEDWEKFISNDTSHLINEGGAELVLPYIKNESPGNPGVAAWSEGSLMDYFGVPPETPANQEVIAFPVAAYALIWDEWFRDQDLQDSKFVPLEEGENPDYTVMAGQLPQEQFPRGWEHDYFTASRPWPQRGDVVTLPLTDTDEVPVTLKTGTIPQITDAQGTPYPVQPGNTEEWLFTSVGGFLDVGQNAANSEAAMIDPNGSLIVNINQTSVSIQTLRERFKMQEFLELDASTGSRYTEIIRGHFGEINPDHRLRRPEYLGSISSRVTFSEVLQTAAPVLDGTVGDGTPLGTMAGHGISVAGGKGFNYHATEHGWLIGMICVMPKASYQQGLDKKWSRRDRYDYPWPKLAHIGMQEIKNKELYVSHSDPEGTFGYIPQYSDARYEKNRVAGSMRTSLKHWHMGRIFNGDVNLNSQFIEADPTNRIFAVQYDGSPSLGYQADQIFAHIYNNVHVLRKLPKYGKPSL